MPKIKDLKNPVSVLVVLEREDVEKIDKTAGYGKRSAYIRWLLKNNNGDAIAREIELEEEVRRLRQRVKSLEAEIEKLKTGKFKKHDRYSTEEEKAYERYRKWRNSLSREYTTELGLVWIASTAKAIGATKRALLKKFEARFDVERHTQNA